jgi:hypothetical protein
VCKKSSQTLKISCEGTLKLISKFNFAFPMLAQTPLDNEQSAVSPSIWTLAELATVMVNGSFFALRKSICPAV